MEQHLITSQSVKCLRAAQCVLVSDLQENVSLSLLKWSLILYNTLSL